jgi:hypothetical protein
MNSLLVKRLNIQWNALREPFVHVHSFIGHDKRGTSNYPLDATEKDRSMTSKLGMVFSGQGEWRAVGERSEICCDQNTENE